VTGVVLRDAMQFLTAMQFEMMFVQMFRFVQHSDFKML